MCSIKQCKFSQAADFFLGGFESPTGDHLANMLQIYGIEWGLLVGHEEKLKKN